MVLKTTETNRHLDKIFFEVKNKLNYEFNDKSLLLESLIHSSYKNDLETEIQIDNQKLEFIGDSVLNLIASSFLLSYKKYSKSEGILTINRANLVKEESLAKYGNILGLVDWIMVSKDGRKRGIHKLTSSIADAFEAIIGALYLDSDYDTTEKIIINKFYETFHNVLLNGDKNYKGIVNELINKLDIHNVNYKVVLTTGPEHSKIFTSELLLNDETVGVGTGKTILESEQMAAKVAENYIRMKYNV